MLRSHLTSRTIQVSILGAIVTLCAIPKTSQAEKAKGSEKVGACVALHKSAVRLELAGHLREAKESYLACAKGECGASIRNQCGARYAQIETDIPSVVPLVTDEAGNDRIDVQVTMDREILTNRVDGRALPVDPGLHEFSVIADGAILARRKVMIVQGQRNRPITLALNQDVRGKKAPTVSTGAVPETKASIETPVSDRSMAEKSMVDKTEPEQTSPEQTSPEKAASEPTPPQVSHGPGIAPFLVGGIGVLGVGTWGALTLWGRRDSDGLAACAPNCSQASVDHVRNLYVAADVALGVGAAGIAASLLLFMANPGSKERPPTQATYRFDVQPTRLGGFATVSGTF